MSYVRNPSSSTFPSLNVASHLTRKVTDCLLDALQDEDLLSFLRPKIESR